MADGQTADDTYYVVLARLEYLTDLAVAAAFFRLLRKRRQRNP